EVLALELEARLARRIGVDDPLARLVGLVDGLVLEDRHGSRLPLRRPVDLPAPHTTSSCVTRRTSSGVVSPASTLSTPSMRSVRNPRSIAPRLMTDADA